MKVKKSRNVPGTYPTGIPASADLCSVTLNPEKEMETKTLKIHGMKLSRRNAGTGSAKPREINSMVEPLNSRS